VDTQTVCIYEFWRFTFVQKEGRALRAELHRVPPMQGASFNLEALKEELAKKATAQSAQLVKCNRGTNARRSFSRAGPGANRTASRWTNSPEEKGEIPLKKHTVSLLAWSLLASALGVGTGSSAVAGPCSADLVAMQAQVDALVDATAERGKSAVESSAATEGRQPTPESVAAAEAALGEGQAARLALAALADGRAADASGDRAGCEKAIARIRSVLQR
jgi:hypothetical protein